MHTETRSSQEGHITRGRGQLGVRRNEGRILPGPLLERVEILDESQERN